MSVWSLSRMVRHLLLCLVSSSSPCTIPGESCFPCFLLGYPRTGPAAPISMPVACTGRTVPELSSLCNRVQPYKQQTFHFQSLKMLTKGKVLITSMMPADAREKTVHTDLPVHFCCLLEIAKSVTYKYFSTVIIRSGLFTNWTYISFTAASHVYQKMCSSWYCHCQINHPNTYYCCVTKPS